ncbi:hypothetical protein KAT82_09140, partial [bacterium]|nr:hypothetical protein [bacterium]
RRSWRGWGRWWRGCGSRRVLSGRFLVRGFQDSAWRLGGTPRYERELTRENPDVVSELQP